MLVQIRLWNLQDKRNTEIFAIGNKNRMRFPSVVFFCFLLSDLKPLSLHICFVWTWSVMCTTDLTVLRIDSDSFPEQIPPVSWRKIGPRDGREVLHNYIKSKDHVRILGGKGHLTLDWHCKDFQPGGGGFPVKV